MNAAAIAHGPTDDGGTSLGQTEDHSYRRFFELPLNRWPLFDSVNLERAKIVLGNDLNPVIDFFNSADVGIGGRNAKQAAAELNLPEADEKRLAALLRLRSYDVYTLRAALGNHLTPDRFETLALPESEKQLLEDYTRDYTRALFALIFEGGKAEASNRQGMRALLEGSTKEIVQRNVMGLVEKFSIKPDELVNYIAGFGEMLLAIAFYRRALDANRAVMLRFFKEIKSLHDSPLMCSRHLDLQKHAAQTLGYGAKTLRLLDGYFKNFQSLGSLWSDISPERFRHIREAVEQQYPVIGATLCIWQVKLNTWNLRFHRRGRHDSDNSLVQFATFFQERTYPDFHVIEAYLDRIEKFENLFGS